MEDKTNSDLNKIKNVFSAYGPILIFALVGVFTLLNHEIWLDEARAWLVSKQFGYLDLITETKSESHPFLWYWILRSVSLFTDQVMALQFTSFLFAAGAVVLLNFYSPFPAYLRVLLSLNYFLLFEYGVVARNYSIEMFFLFLVCASWNDKFVFYKNRYPQVYILFCSLLAASHFYGTLIATVFIGPFIYEWIKERRPIKEKNYYFYFFLAAIFYGSAIWLAIPDGYHHFGILRPEWPHLHEILRSFYSVVKSSFAPEILDDYDLKANYNVIGSFAFLLLAIGYAFYAWLLRAHRQLMYLWLGVALAFTLMHLARSHEAVPPRHVGQYTLLFIATAWVGLGLRQVNRTLIIAIGSLIFSLQAYYGAKAIKLDFEYPYSDGKKTAEFILKEYPDYEIMPELAFLTSSVMAYLQRPYYDYEEGKSVLVSNLDPRLLKNVRLGGSPEKRLYFTDEKYLYERIHFVACNINPKILVISSSPINSKNFITMNTQFVFGVDKALRPYESFFIFKVNINNLENFCSML